MMEIVYRDGLLYTSITIVYKGCSKTINNIVIDTGASDSIVSVDAVDDIGIYAEVGDKIISLSGVGGSLHNAFVKKIDCVKFGNLTVNNFEMDFGIIDNKGEINGLLGLDLLIKAGAIIDLKRFKLFFK